MLSINNLEENLAYYLRSYNEKIKKNLRDVGSDYLGLNNDALVSGTSNGVSWTGSQTSIYYEHTTADRTFRLAFNYGQFAVC